MTGPRKEDEPKYEVWLGMPKHLAKENLIYPSSVGVIIHTGAFDLEKRRRLRTGEPEVLLVKQADQKIGDVNPWGIPAGRRVGNETFLETAAREVLEETGIEIELSRFEWFCPFGDDKVILSYEIPYSEIPNIDKAEKLGLDIKLIPPPEGVNRKEIGELALVPVEVFFDHMSVGSHRIYRPISDSVRYWKPREVLLGEKQVFVPAVYKPDIWQAIRHQMFVRNLIPPYLG